MTVSGMYARNFLVSSGALVTSIPLIRAVPDVGSTKFRNRLIVVVLPAP
jgi:hypothetical protein